jgi:hypothetical protein
MAATILVHNTFGHDEQGLLLHARSDRDILGWSRKAILALNSKHDGM